MLARTESRDGPGSDPGQTSGVRRLGDGEYRLRASGVDGDARRRHRLHDGASAARDGVAATGFEPMEDPDLPLRYCVIAQSLQGVMLGARPFSDPPMGLGSLVEEPARLEGATFRCERYRDDHETARALWAQIEPLPFHELAWPGLARAASE